MLFIHALDRMSPPVESPHRRTLGHRHPRNVVKQFLGALLHSVHLIFLSSTKTDPLLWAGSCGDQECPENNQVLSESRIACIPVASPPSAPTPLSASSYRWAHAGRPRGQCLCEPAPSFPTPASAKYRRITLLWSVAYRAAMCFLGP